MTTRTIVIGNSTDTPKNTSPSSGTIKFVEEPNNSTVKTPEEVKALLELGRLEQLANQGRFAWTKKHSYLGHDSQYHELWELLIPSYGCSCMQDYKTYKETNPPDFSTDYSYFVWGVNLHRWVCVKLGRPELTLEQALERWNRKFDEQGNSVRT